MHRIIYTVVCLLLAKSLNAAEVDVIPKKLTLAVPVATATSVQGPWLELIYRDVFQRLGIEITILPMPAKRASVMAGAALVDGELHRSKAYGESHPNMLRVEQSHFAARYAFYSKQPDLQLANDWDSFRDKKLRVAYILGSVTATAKLPLLVPPERLSTVTDAQMGLRKMGLGRIDVLVGLDLIVDPLLELDEYKQFGVRKVAKLREINGYLYLQKKYSALAPKVAHLLLQMKRDHLIEKYEKQARQTWRPAQPN